MRALATYKRLISTLLLLMVLCWGLPVAAAGKTSPAAPKAADTTKSKTQDISNEFTQSYDADTTVQTGMIVKLKDKAPHTVVPLPDDDITAMLGVVIPQANASVVLLPQNVTTQQVLVATSGHFNVIVSNQNGGVKVGDYVTISAIAGVGMKANQDNVQVVGKAAGNFTGNANVIGSMKLKDSLGRETAVSLGRIPVDINISHNPIYNKPVDYVPGFLAKIAQTVANHPVSAARIYLCTALLVITGIITGNMLYSGVRNGMNAVGRNPLSKKSIIKSLIQTVVAGLIIFTAGVLAVYLLLKL